MTSLHPLAALTGRAGSRRTSPLRAVALAASLGLCGAIAPAVASATSFEVLHHFDGTHGREPFGGVAIDASGTIYGATVSGGLRDRGVVWRLQDHAFDVIHAFRGAPRDGEGGYGGVVIDNRGRLVGTTAWGGANDAGTVWTVDTVSGYRLLSSHPGGAAGRGLQAGLSVAADGRLYGAALYGGDAGCDCGAVFRVDGATGAVTPLHAFTGGDGSYPVAPPLAQGNALHGTTVSGGNAGVGTPFSMSTEGAGYVPVPAAGTQFNSGLVADASGALWGAWRGGETDNGGLYRIDAAGTYAQVHRFTGLEGYWPTGTLAVGPDGALYGTTSGGGRNGAGTVFRFDPVTTRLSTIHAFRGTDGGHPQAGVTVDAQGRLVGVTTNGGRNDAGVVYRIAP